jgi:hypothetical protein
MGKKKSQKPEAPPVAKPPAAKQPVAKAQKQGPIPTAAKQPAAAPITQAQPVPKPPPFKKANIPRAVREQIWLRQFGKVYEGKCPTPWCQNVITVHDFQSGHNIPESKGGPTTAENLLPLCGRCNQSMGNHYTFDEWSLLGKEPAQPAQIQKSPEQITQIKKPWYCWCFRI